MLFHVHWYSHIDLPEKAFEGKCSCYGQILTRNVHMVYNLILILYVRGLLSFMTKAKYFFAFEDGVILLKLRFTMGNKKCSF